MERLRLHDVEDVHGLVTAVIVRSGLVLSFHDREDLQQELVIHAWTISGTFDPERGSFSNYLFKTASLRIVDWTRKKNGRTRWVFGDGRVHERPRPEFVPLDGLLDTELAGSGDPASDCSPDLERVLGQGSGTRTRDYDALGLDAA